MPNLTIYVSDKDASTIQEIRGMLGPIPLSRYLMKLVNQDKPTLALRRRLELAEELEALPHPSKTKPAGPSKFK